MKEDPFITSFTTALYKAQKWVYEQPASTVAKAIAPYFEDTDLALIEQVVERYRDQKSYAENPLIEEAEFNNLLDVMKEAGVLEYEPKYEELVNRKFADKAVK